MHATFTQFLAFSSCQEEETWLPFGEECAKFEIRNRNRTPSDLSIFSTIDVHYYDSDEVYREMNVAIALQNVRI